MSEMQTDLALDRPVPVTTVNWLEKLLLESRCWMSAGDIMATTQGRALERDIRELASASNGRIISGQKGYRHTSNASPEEIQHAAAWLESQGKKMGERAQAIRRYAHSVFGR